MASSDTEDKDCDEFQDACDDEILASRIDLDSAVQEAKQAIHYFFNNQFDEARNLMKPWADVSMYHALGNSVFSFLQAMLTFEQQHIAEASDALKKSLTVCNKYRKKNTLGESLGKIVKKPNYDQYTEEECHAELCYAESLLLKALLTFMEDETLSSFIRGGIKIRSCYNSYKDCNNILKNRTWDKSSTKIHFESGVRMGIGTFNLMISLLPSRVIKLLEFMGFSGNKQLGLKDLEEGYDMKNGLRQVLCVMTLLSYHLIVLYVLSHQEGDLNACEDILKTQLSKYPNGVWFLFFKGRLEFMKGNLDESVDWYTRSWKSQNIWPQFHHMCFWELLWVNCLRLNWTEASMFASFLVEESKWSRTIYSYQKAAILCMKEDELSVSEKATIERLMNDVPKYKQRIAGKSLPMEKFAVKKTERFFSQNKTLVLPVIELMFLWNMFKIAKKNFNLASKIYRLIEKKLESIENEGAKNKYYYDNKALVLLLKGACLRHMNSPLQALESLELVISMQKQLKDDHYIVPYAIVELAFISMDEGQNEKAILALEDAKRNYTGYSLESRLHFRIHTALSELKGNKNEKAE